MTTLFYIISLKIFLLFQIMAENLHRVVENPKILALDDARYIAGKFDPAQNPEFISFNSDSSNKLMHLRTEVYIAYLKMAQAAEADSVKLTIVSATRNFDYQKELWENKWIGKTAVDGKKLHLHIKDPQARALKIMEYSAPPGFSRHHWGTDIDINSTESEYFETPEGKKVYQWLFNNANKFGFCQTYTAFGEKRSSGFHEERWHWSYMPTAKIIWEAQLRNFDESKIFKFKGYQAIRSLHLIEFIRSVNNCIQ